MRYKSLIIFLYISLSLSSSVSAYAKDITFSVNQSEYYFLVGENAVIPLEIDNSYDKQIDGMLSYTTTQQISQRGFSYSSSNTQSKSLTADKGKNTIGIGFGKSDSPAELKVGLSFNYNDGKEQRIVDMDDILIHFVSDSQQKQNQENPVRSSSQEYSQQPQQHSDPFAQQEQQMQKMMDKMLGNKQQQQQSTEQKMQNNQMAQDSSALKQQMQKQFQEQQSIKEEFQKQLVQNEEFQKQHQELLNQGYNLTGGNLDPSSNNTGKFELNYERQDGEQATLKGDMKDGNLDNLQKTTSEDKKNILEQLNHDKEFQEMQKELQNQGFKQKNTEFSQKDDKTTAQLNYINHNNETAAVKAEFVNNTLKKVELEKKEDKKRFNWLWLLLIIPLLFIAYLLYKRYAKNPEAEEKQDITEKPFDYVAESNKLLEKSKKLFENKNYKDAYGTAAQATRLFLSYKNNLKKELTNDDIIEHLRKHKKQYKEAKECFDLCSLVEFAKYEANKKDFSKIIRICEKIIEE